MGMREDDKVKLCVGCRDDFYNHGGRGLGGGRCWNLKGAKLVTRFRIHRDAMPAHHGSFEQMKVFACKNGEGWFYYEKLPDFVKLEDVINSPEWKKKHQPAPKRPKLKDAPDGVIPI